MHRNANVRPFVTANFRDKTLRTSTVDGSSPTWNEQIVIPIKYVIQNPNQIERKHVEIIFCLKFLAKVSIRSRIHFGFTCMMKLSKIYHRLIIT